MITVCYLITHFGFYQSVFIIQSIHSAFSIYLVLNVHYFQFIDKMAFFKPGYKPAEVTKCVHSGNEKCKRETKGSMVGLSTFISWGKENVLGHETGKNFYFGIIQW